MPEKLYQVDINDIPSGFVYSDELYCQKARHRVSHALVFDEFGNLLLQQRSTSKKFCPLHWSSSAQGHVRFGETYEGAAKREAKEELGIIITPILFSKFLYLSDIEKFVGVCIAQNYSGDLTLNKKEVERCETVPIRRLEDFLADKQIHPEFILILKEFLPTHDQRIKNLIEKNSQLCSS
ncbi:MAG TPA: NUDIX domain-containing protein [Nanoarchaeota archaeon]|nr:NUDIX domain-containing protein [Candidatus Pacearchaeota archaeon]HIH17235.1 NUDIX domain-containing protein [Nanoarchaeota archaeon]HIH51004.1 NUDIX domain-containing protein [Nanoarchaeota archaeon]HIH66101.1 NUDIX domain-containing protein [Nanoarchaeota archaeon]